MKRGHPRNWYKQKETEARGRKCSAPYQNIVIGSDPLDGMTTKVAESYDVIVNVSHSECAYFYPAYAGQRMYWIPVNEMGVWNYSAFVQFAKIMEFHHSKKHKIYVHCHAGAYRSPTMTMVWLRACQEMPYKFGRHNLKTQMSWEEAYRISRGETKEEYKKEYTDTGKIPFRLRYFRGNMPPAFNEFVARLKANINSTYTYIACIEQYERGPISKDREIRAKIQGWKTSAKISRFLRSPYTKLKSKYNDFQEWFGLFKKGKKKIYLEKRRGYSSSVTIEGDDFIRTQIRKYIK